MQPQKPGVVSDLTKMDISRLRLQKTTAFFTDHVVKYRANTPFAFGICPNKMLGNGVSGCGRWGNFDDFRIHNEFATKFLNVIR